MFKNIFYYIYLIFFYRTINPTSSVKFMSVLACWLLVISGIWFGFGEEQYAQRSSYKIVCILGVIGGLFGVWWLNKTGNTPYDSDTDNSNLNMEGVVLSAKSTKSDIGIIGMFCASAIALNLIVSLNHGVSFYWFGGFIALISVVWVYSLKKSIQAFYCFDEYIKFEFYARSINVGLADISRVDIRKRRKKTFKIVIWLSNGKKLKKYMRNFKREDILLFVNFLRDKNITTDILDIQI